MTSTLKPIRTQADYAAAQQRAAALLLTDPPLGSLESDELDILGTLITAYDREHDPIGPADPIAAITFAMDQREWSARDLVPYLGTRSRVSEVLNGKRRLSLEQIARLHHGLGIPLECLIPGPETKRVAKSPGKKIPTQGGKKSRAAAPRVVYQ